MTGRHHFVKNCNAQLDRARRPKTAQNSISMSGCSSRYPIEFLLTGSKIFLTNTALNSAPFTQCSFIAARRRREKRSFVMPILVSDGAFLARAMINVFAALLLSGCANGGQSPIAPAVDQTSSLTSEQTAPAESVIVPILLYHHVRPGSTSALFVSPEELDKQLEYLQYYGFHTISFTDLADYFEKRKPLPLHPIIISFDDGWENQFEYGFPLLQKYHDTATFYVVTDYLDHPNFMTTEQLRTMVAAGMTIGCHTRSHPYLTSLGGERLRDEIEGAKAILETEGFKIDTFAYPYGAYNQKVVAMVQAAGFRSARTADGGTRVTAEKL
jgi:peptidoglycan/xylan/chitin deacetylase (PgdA/CDA1 family)